MSDETPALIEVRGLVKRYGNNVVLDGLTLTVERGETCVIVGGSGSGKSTFARLLVGLERPDDGAIRVDGVDIAGLHGRALERIRRKFAMVFQGRALLDSLTVFDNVAFPLREAGKLGESDIGRQVHLALGELDVDEASSRLPGALSGGMAKRVGIARALVMKPEILVYDEPTSGLDPVSSRSVDQLIERMRERHGVTSIIITHDMVTAYDVADRVVLLADGKIAVQGTPEQLFRAHTPAIEPFVLASGIDLDRLASREKRASVAAVRAVWEGSR